MSSSDQRLISKRDFDDFFASSWIAGTVGLKNQKNNSDGVNVPAICDKLTSLLVTTPQTRNELEDPALQTISCVGQVETTSPISFRIASRLCYGTLRIHQLQVDRLLEMSRDLCARSNCELNKVVIFKAPKRKSNSSAVTCVAAKKRRYVQTSTQKETTVTQFSQMLNDVEDLVQWSKVNDIQMEETTTVKPIAQKRLQIREITIHETIMSLDDNEADGDYLGFGDTTANENTTELINYFSEKFTQSKVISQNSLKRKASIELNFNHKLPKDTADSTIEMERAACSSAAAGSISSSSAEICAYDFQRNSTEVRSQCDTNPNEIDYWADANADASTIHPTPEHNSDIGPVDPDQTNNNMDDFTMAALVNSQHAETPSPLPPPKNKRKSKSSIDNRVELGSKEIFTKLENYAKSQIDIKKQFKQMKPKSKGHRLLHGLNRNHILKRDFKPKYKNTQEDAERDYFSIICDIFSDQPNANIDVLATEIYPNWQQVELENNRNSRKRKLAPEVIEREHNLIHELDENLNLIGGDYQHLELATLAKTLETNTATAAAAVIAGDDGTQCLETDEDSKWRPYGVMMQLIDIWRCPSSSSSDYEVDSDGGINAQRFCWSAGNRRLAALAFGSLLDLIAKQFIVITKAANSIKMGQIKLGTESINMISNIEVNNN